MVLSKTTLKFDKDLCLKESNKIELTTFSCNDYILQGTINTNMQNFSNCFWTCQFVCINSLSKYKYYRFAVF